MRLEVAVCVCVLLDTLHWIRRSICVAMSSHVSFEPRLFPLVKYVIDS